MKHSHSNGERLSYAVRRWIVLYNAEKDTGFSLPQLWYTRCALCLHGICGEEDPAGDDKMQRISPCHSVL